MKWRVYWLALGLFVVTLGYNGWYWGGAVQIHDLGPIIRARAAHEAPLVDSYLSLGEQVLRLTGQVDAARASAEAAFGPARERLLANPGLAMSDLFGHSYSAAQSVLRVSHWLCPLSLVIGLIGWFMRPRQIDTRRVGLRYGR